MVIKFLLFFLLSLPALASEKQKTFHEFEVIGNHILSDEAIDLVKVKEFNLRKASLEESGYEEGKADKLSSKVDAHILAIQNQVYETNRYAFLDYTSWQENVTLKTPGGNRTLIVTNQGWCGGAGFGKRNVKFHFAGEACFLYGRGDIGSDNPSVTYRQNNVYGRGIKVAPAAGLIVSSSGAELGLKLPILWFDQKFSSPALAGYKTRDPSAIQGFLDVYTRWPFGLWFVQSDIGKSLGKDLTIWSLGFGRQF